MRAQVRPRLAEQLPRVLAVLVLVLPEHVGEAALAVRPAVGLQRRGVLDVVLPSVDRAERELAAVAARVRLDALAVAVAGRDGRPVLGLADAPEVFAVSEAAMARRRPAMRANAHPAGRDAVSPHLDRRLQLAAAVKDRLQSLAARGVVERQAARHGAGLVDRAGLPARRLQAHRQGTCERVAVRPLVLDVVPEQLAHAVQRGVRVDDRAALVHPLGVLAHVLVARPLGIAPHEPVALAKVEGRGYGHGVLPVQLVGVNERDQIAGADGAQVGVVAAVHVHPHHSHLSTHDRDAVPAETFRRCAPSMGKKSLPTSTAWSAPLTVHRCAPMSITTAWEPVNAALTRT